MEAIQEACRTAVQAGAGLALLLVAACGCAVGGGAAATADGVDRSLRVSKAVVRITPADGAEDVDPAEGLRVTAERGRLSKVRVEDGEGREVAGRTSPDGRSWEPDGRLAPATGYTVDAVAVDALGREAARHAAFTTLVPRHTFVAFVTPDDGATVGVGMEVSFTFNRPVMDRRAVERAISVSAEPYAEVEPHWFGRQRLDFRPAEYWLPGTRVTVRSRLDDVEGAPGVYGTQSDTLRFTVGRSQVSTVDAAAHMMTVRRNGRFVRTLPITAGSPDNATYNGKMVITEKLPVTRMNGDTVGFGGEYDIPDVPHAMRLTTSGTFIHGNYWAGEDTFGHANTTHGCIGLHDVKAAGAPPGAETPAAWFYDHSLVGDVVEVIGSPDVIVTPYNGLNGWNMDWRTWLAGSALR